LHGEWPWQMVKFMFKPLLKPYFLIAIALYIIVRLGRLSWYTPNEWVNNYMNDLLCMPIILTICLVGVRYLKRLPQFNLTPIMIFGMTTFYAVLFEYSLPNSSPLYTADIIDVIMYFAGAVFYWFYWRMNREKVSAVIL
jgi:hypothetical protein